MNSGEAQLQPPLPAQGHVSQLPAQGTQAARRPQLPAQGPATPIQGEGRGFPLGDAPTHRTRAGTDQLRVYFANVTSWSSHALDYATQVASNLARSHVMCVAEHHKRGPALVETIKRLRRLGWSTTAEGAAETGTATVREGPGHGGVWVATRASLQGSGMPLDVKRAVQRPEHQGLSTQWTARQIRTRGTTLLIVVLYLAPGQGLAGSNLVTLTEVGTYIRGMGLPYVLMGDYNMEVEELNILLMERFLKGTWVHPERPVPGGHRPIDLVLVANTLAAGAQLTWDDGGPWAAPHSGLMLTLNLQACHQLTQLLHQPLKIVPAHGPDLPWGHHQRQGALVAQEGARRLEQVLDYEPHHRDRELDMQYMEFTAAAEHLLLQRQGDEAPIDEGACRGWAPRVRQRPLQPPRPPGWLERPSGLARWMALKAHLVHFHRTKVKSMNEQAHHHRLRVRELAEHIRGQPRILDGQNGALELDILAHIVDHADSQGQDCVARLGAFTKKLQAHLMRQSHVRFREWIANSLKVGGGALHKYTKGLGIPRQKLAPAFDDTGKEILPPIDVVESKAKYWGTFWQATGYQPQEPDWWPEFRRRAAQQEPAGVDQ